MADVAVNDVPAPPAPPDPPIPPPPVAPAATGQSVRVRVGYPTTTFLSGVDGVPDITTSVTEIPAASLEAVQIAARKAGVKLIEETQ